ncbi:MAG TPA: class I SAM-dependent methyltransferase [Rubrivivax sp.]|jgi:SAM-dependent methyltransferase|nr:methyltransferase domain-containing protein [Rhodoferax sp.]MCL4740123.1 methyltransferase domain-containing protein [Burkholderiaceae bacterium]MCP5288583.1 methyltransferase domain-containing protein [Burkholderiaceae bacterium]HMR69144.1 class I SAM-dependent methyltransferase [Rubrivivax sp.]
MNSTFADPTVVPDDDELWRQIKRTVNGKPVGPEQIRLIVDAIVDGLDLAPSDTVLDIACGNGALTRHLVDRVSSVHGSDISRALIDVASTHFTRPGRCSFEVADAASSVRTIERPERFTKVLCYGSFSYFSPQDAAIVLKGLHDRFMRVDRVFVGNLPDRDLAGRFYRAGIDPAPLLDDAASAIGQWRTAAQFDALARASGWSCQIRRMPASFYAAHYRYDAVLERTT